MKHTFLFLILIIFFFGCNTNSTTGDQSISVASGRFMAVDSLVNISVDLPKFGPFNFDDKLYNVNYIPLETNKNSIIGDISKLIFYNNKFYILDAEYSMSVLVFNEDGSFLNKIERRGRGPGEYNDIWDFDIDKFSNEIVILANSPLKIIRLTLEGEYISEANSDSFSAEIAVLKNKNYAMYLQYRNDPDLFRKEDNLIFIDSSATITGGIHTYNHLKISKHFIKTPQSFYHYNNETYFYPALIDTVYRVVNNSLIPVYSFDFGADAFDKEILKNDIAKQDIYFSNAKYASFYCIYETKDMLFYFINRFPGFYRGYYSKGNEQSIIGTNWPGERYLLGKPVGNTERMFIDQIETMSLIQKKDQILTLSDKLDKHLIEIIKNCDESDNPVLVTYQIDI